MKKLDPEIFTLENFEGPLDFLLHLVQKNEIDIYDIRLQKITEQFIQRLGTASPGIDNGAEFIGLTASLMWLKSRMLLPKHEQAIDPEELEQDPRFEIIHQLIEYCRFKDASKELIAREQRQNAFYSRGLDAPDIKKNLGIEHLTLEDLAGLFQQVLAKASSQTREIHEEKWLVSDKIVWIRKRLKAEKEILFEVLFTPELSKEELIVIFLAVLELMKLGEARVVKDLIRNCVIFILNKEFCHG